MPNLTEKIEELKKLEAKATKGPFGFSGGNFGVMCKPRWGETKETLSPLSSALSYQDAEYLAALCNAFPTLISEIERLRLQLADANLPSANHSRMTAMCTKLMEENKRLRAESAIYKLGAEAAEKYGKIVDELRKENAALKLKPE